MTRRGQLVLLTGPDGAGKSTVARALAAQWGTSTLLVDKELGDVPGNPTLSDRLRLVNDMVFRAPADHGNEWGDHHWLYALAAWYSLVDTCIVRPAIAAGQDVIMDNEPNKVRARFLVDEEVHADVVEAAFANLTTPDAVVLLNVDPVTALHRKRGFTLVESGFRGTFDNAFLTRQERIREQLLALAEANRWTVIDTTRRTVDEVVQVVDAAVRGKRAALSAGRAGTAIDAAGHASLPNLHRG